MMTPKKSWGSSVITDLSKCQEGGDLMFDGYKNSGRFFDEMFDENGGVRSHYKGVYRHLSNIKANDLTKRQQYIDLQMSRQGITFTLYKTDEADALERTIPFDLIPRIIPKEEWEYIESGLKQRVIALNRFLWDIYHEQSILKDGIIPRRMIVSNLYFRPEMVGVDVPGGVYIPFSGIDLIRDEKGTYYVLEDNLRSPSGVSYLYKNRALMRQMFSELFDDYEVDTLYYGLNHFSAALRGLAVSKRRKPKVVLLTPGSYNSAYFEHTFLAREMGIDLVEGRDLLVVDHRVYLRGMQGREQVDVIYRRIDDEFLDPLAFRPDSMLGVPGLLNAYRAGNVTIANAPGTGVADDKAIYAYVPDMIRYYLKEEPILPNVPTYLLDREEERRHVIENIEKMVVKETSLSGGYGMLIGPHASPEEINEFIDNINREPARYIAQPTIALSRIPALVENKLGPRHIDLRPYIIMGAGEQVRVIPGGLTRVALKEGSLVVNSSQGGGSKDTWVLST